MLERDWRLFNEQGVFTEKDFFAEPYQNWENRPSYRLFVRLSIYKQSLLDFFPASSEPSGRTLAPPYGGASFLFGEPSKQCKARANGRQRRGPK